MNNEAITITKENYMEGVNLDEYMKEKQGSKPITVAGTVFNIATFPIISNVLYNQYVDMSKQSIDNVKKSIELISQIELEKDDKKKNRLTAKLEKMKKNQITDEDIRKPLNDCLKYMLQANGYEYNKKFWAENCDDLKLGMFIHLASNRGMIDELIKKKAV